MHANLSLTQLCRVPFVFIACIARAVPVASTSDASQLEFWQHINLTKDEVWLRRLETHRAWFTSGACQDGLLEEIVNHVGAPGRFYVEFGYNTPTLCGGTGPNICQLHKKGWKGLLLDGKFSNASINLHAVGWIKPSNIANIFTRFKVPREVDYLSVDVDMMDIWILRATLHAGWRPRIITAEYSPSWPCGSFAAPSPDNEYLSTTDGCLYSASLRSYGLVAKKYGYRIVAIEPQLDAFFVRRDLLKSAPWPIAYLERGLDRHGAPKNRAWMIKHGINIDDCIPYHNGVRTTACGLGMGRVPNDYAKKPRAVGSFLDFRVWLTTGSIMAAKRSLLEKYDWWSTAIMCGRGSGTDPSFAHLLDPLNGNTWNCRDAGNFSECISSRRVRLPPLAPGRRRRRRRGIGT